jgi:AcrR family transcriptional regulator
MMNLVKRSPQDVSTKRQRSPASRSPARAETGSANREQLMDIALALFARHGIARISLNAIAKEAGVTPAMLHYYFSSREALVEKLIEERFMPLRSEIGQIFVAHRRRSGHRFYAAD